MFLIDNRTPGHRDGNAFDNKSHVRTDGPSFPGSTSSLVCLRYQDSGIGCSMKSTTTSICKVRCLAAITDSICEQNTIVLILQCPNPFGLPCMCLHMRYGHDRARAGHGRARAGHGILKPLSSNNIEHELFNTLNSFLHSWVLGESILVSLLKFHIISMDRGLGFYLDLFNHK